MYKALPFFAVPALLFSGASHANGLVDGDCRGFVITGSGAVVTSGSGAPVGACYIKPDPDGNQPAAVATEPTEPEPIVIVPTAIPQQRKIKSVKDKVKSTG